MRLEVVDTQRHKEKDQDPLTNALQILLNKVLEALGGFQCGPGVAEVVIRHQVVLGVPHHIDDLQRRRPTQGPTAVVQGASGEGWKESAEGNTQTKLPKKRSPLLAHVSH